MAKQKRLDPELKQAINFSDLNSLEKGLGIALGKKWNEVSINDVPEDKIELVEDWINNNRGKYKGINISIGSTYTRQLVLIFSGIDELKKGLSSAIKRKFRKIIVEDVSKEERKTANDWIKKNQGEYKDINIEVRVPYKGLHPNEKEKIRNKVGANESFFDDSTLHLEGNGEKLFFDNWINSESPQKRIDRIEREINHKQKTYKIKGIGEIEKKTIKLELEYLKQLRDQNKIEIEIFDELKKQTEKTLEVHSKRGKGPRMDKDPLNLSIGEFDKYMISQTDEDLSTSEVALQFELYVKSNFKEYKHFIIEVRNEDDNLEYWKTVRGDRKKMTASWDYMYRRFYRARNNRKKEAKRKK